MTLTVRDLMALLAQVPGDAEVVTWDPEFGEECAVEQVFMNGVGLVLSLDVQPGEVVAGAVVLWTANATAAKGIAKAQAEWTSAKREWVGS